MDIPDASNKAPTSPVSLFIPLLIDMFLQDDVADSLSVCDTMKLNHCSEIDKKKNVSR